MSKVQKTQAERWQGVLEEVRLAGLADQYPIKPQTTLCSPKTDLSPYGFRKVAWAPYMWISEKSLPKDHDLFRKGEIFSIGLASEYFSDSEYLLRELNRPFIVLEKENQFDVTVKVVGGGHSGQADAIQLGIAKALALVNEDFKGALKRADLLGRDPREKERKKFGLKKARKQRQFTKR